MRVGGQGWASNTAQILAWLLAIIRERNPIRYRLQPPFLPSLTQNKRGKYNDKNPSRPWLVQRSLFGTDTPTASGPDRLHGRRHLRQWDFHPAKRTGIKGSQRSPAEHARKAAHSPTVVLRSIRWWARSPMEMESDYLPDELAAAPTNTASFLGRRNNIPTGV